MDIELDLSFRRTTRFNMCVKCSYQEKGRRKRLEMRKFRAFSTVTCSQMDTPLGTDVLERGRGQGRSTVFQGSLGGRVCWDLCLQVPVESFCAIFFFCFTQKPRLLGWGSPWEWRCPAGFCCSTQPRARALLQLTSGFWNLRPQLLLVSLPVMTFRYNLEFTCFLKIVRSEFFVVVVKLISLKVSRRK